MDKCTKKEKDTHQLQKKLTKPGLTLSELLQEQNVVECFRAGNQPLHSFFKLKDYRDMIQYVTVLGPDEDKLRSYKLPQVSCDILVSEIPVIWEVMFTSITENESGPPLVNELLRYWEGQPNYVLSGYVVRILFPLYQREPVRLQQLLFDGAYPFKMLNFLSSRSVSDLLIKLIVVEYDLLLTLYFKERKELLEEIIAIYERNDRDEETLAEVSHILCEVLSKLWTAKHKELGRFSQQILKIIHVVISKSRLYNQELLLLMVMRHLYSYLDDAPYLIKAITLKAYKELSSSSYQTIKVQSKTQINKFGIKRLRLLQCMAMAFSQCLVTIQSMPNLHMYFSLLLNLMTKHEWNSMVHVEVQRIFLELFKNASVELFRSLFQKAHFSDSIKELIKKEERKTIKGYSGCLTNILMGAWQHAKKGSPFGQYLSKEEPRFIQLLEQYLKPKERLYVYDLGGYQTVTNYAKPQYDTAELLQRHRQFLERVNINLESELLTGIVEVQDEALAQYETENMLNRTWGLKDKQAKQPLVDK